MKKQYGISGVFLLVLFLVAGCVSTPLKHDPALSAPVKIGVILPLSGADGARGERFRRGVDFAVNETNLSSGVAGRSLEVIYLDSQGVPEQAAAGIAELCRQGAVAVISGGSENEMCAILPEAAKNHVPVIAGLTTADRFTWDKNIARWGIRATFTNTQQGRVLGAYLKYWRNLERVAVLVEESDEFSYSRSIAKALREQFEHSGGTVIFGDVFKPGKEDPELLKRLLITEPDAIFIGAAEPGEAARWVQMLRKAGYRGVLTGADSWDDDEFLRHCGQFPGDCVFTSLYAPDAPGENNKKFRKDFREKSFYFPDDCEAQGYDAVRLICRAIAYSGSLEEFHDALGGIYDYPGAAAAYTYVNGKLHRSVFLKTLRPAGKEGAPAVSRYRLTLNPGRLELFREKLERLENGDLWDDEEEKNDEDNTFF